MVFRSRLDGGLRPGCGAETEVCGVPDQVRGPEGALVGEEEVVHLSEGALPGCRFGALRG